MQHVDVIRNHYLVKRALHVQPLDRARKPVVRRAQICPGRGVRMTFLPGPRSLFSAARKSNVIEKRKRFANMRHLIIRNPERIFEFAAMDCGVTGGHADHVCGKRAAHHDEKKNVFHVVSTGRVSIRRLRANRWYIRRISASTGTLRKMPVTPPSSPPAKTPKITSSGCSSTPRLIRCGEST